MIYHLRRGGDEVDTEEDVVGNSFEVVPGRLRQAHTTSSSLPVSPKPGVSTILTTSENYKIKLTVKFCPFPSQGQKPYGSVSRGRGKWPFRVIFFLKVELSCGQTVKDKFDFSIVLSQLYLLDHQNTSCWTS